MCFGGSDDSASREMIQMQKDEAKRIAKAEDDRQTRIKQGLQLIRNMFKGAPVMKDVAQKFDWSKATLPANAKGVGTGVSGLPAGFTYVQVPAPVAGGGGAVTPAGGAAQRSSSRLRGGGTASRDSPGSSKTSGYRNVAVVGGEHGPQGGMAKKIGGAGPAAAVPAATTWAIKGPDGKIYQSGEDIGWNTKQDTGKVTGDWQKKFYDAYKQKILDYYNPQVTEQLGEAKDETTYRLARAGTLGSTAGVMSAADLQKQKLLRQGEVASKADTAAAELKNRVAKEMSAAESQLYATENPEVAANQATAAIQNITAESPDLSPLAEIFNIAAIGGANLMKGASNASRLAGGYGSGGGLGRNQKIL